MSWYDFPVYKPVGDLKSECQSFIKQYKKNNNNIQPVIIEGKKIATTWWGEAWNKNLEKYSDYDNRLSRGRTYVRSGCVIDLKIYETEVIALVKGSSLYTVRVRIAPLLQAKEKALSQKCIDKIENINDLVAGNFPKELAELFQDKKNGLFPSSREIHFSCDCPDDARMCKHVAAVLYGIGRRFDDDPMLFFKLRKINIRELIKNSISEKISGLMSKSKQHSERIIEDSEIDMLFGLSEAH